jgi:hypothetical protein
LAAFLAKVRPDDKAAVKSWLHEHGLLNRSREIVAVYEYQDARGRAIGRVVRTNPKGFYQEKSDGKGGWTARGFPATLYNLPAVLKETSVLIPEGEKDCETGKGLGLAATCNPGGAGKWKPKFAEYLRGNHVVIVADADAPGLDHARGIARSLVGVAASVRLIEALPGGLKDLSDWVAAGGTREQLEKLIAEAHDLTAAEVAAWSSSPVAVVNLAPGKLPEVVDKAEQVLMPHAEALGVFQRVGELVRVISLPELKSNGGLKRPAGTVQLEPLSTVVLTDIFDRIARWQRVNADGNAHVVDCPPRIATIYRSRRGAWRLPILTGIVSAPILRGDGTVLSGAGYDAQTGLFLTASGFPKIPDNPTSGDARRALEELLEPFNDFPFVAAEDRSALAAAILTGVQRRLLGACPLFGFTAPAQRTGKSLLAEAAAIIATGKPAPAMAVSGEREEIRKAVASALREGHQIVNLDNVEHPLASPDLARAITQSEYADRALGENRLLRLPTNILWTATGNNLTFRGDLSSRVLLCRIDSGLERPEERNFRIPNLVEHLHGNRQRLIAAALTVLRAYHVAGRPSQKVIAWGGFEGWSRSIREPLVWVGLPDPCATRKYVVADDPDWEEAAAIFAAWHDGFKNKSATVKEAAVLAETDVALRDALSAVAVARHNDKLDTRRIGHWLKRWENRIVVGLQLRRDGESHRAIRWRVVKPSGQGPVSYTSSGEFLSATQSAVLPETGAETSDLVSSRPERTRRNSPNSPGDGNLEPEGSHPDTENSPPQAIRGPVEVEF